MTTQATHTPGPWTAHKAGIYDATGLCVAKRHPQAGPEWIINAPVLAAAPDLLAALEALFDNCAMIHSRWGDEYNQKEANAAIAAARAAIAKAKGD